MISGSRDQREREREITTKRELLPEARETRTTK